MASTRIDHSDEIALREWEQHEADLRAREKKDATVTVDEHRASSSDDEAATLAEHWQPGLKARFPWIGAAALFVMLICMGLVVLILTTSNRKAQEEWPVYMKWHWINDKWKGRTQLSPSTALALVNTVSNLSLAIAIGQGIAIAWWRKALVGATVEDLHKSWGYGTSVLSLATAGKNFNLIALAALAAKLALVDNVLLQRSAGSVPGTFKQPIDNLRFPAVESLPAGFLGQFDDNSGAGYLSRNFSEGLRNWFESTLLISLNSVGNNANGDAFPTHCSGTCETYIEAFGFNVTCTPNTIQTFNITPETARSNVFNASNANSTIPGQDATLLNLFSYPVRANEQSTNGDTTTTYPEPWISLAVDYAISGSNYAADGFTPLDTCTSQLHSSTCAFRPAVVRYPIAITNYTSNLHAVNGINITAPDFVPLHQFMSDDRFPLQNGQTWGKEVIRPLYHTSPEEFYSNIDSVAHVLRTVFAADVTLQYLNGTGYVATPGQGSMSQWYVGGSITDTVPRTCDVSVKDPVVWVVDQINNLMLRASIAAAFGSDSYPKTFASGLKGTQTHDTVRFDSDYAFMGAALGVMFLCILAVIPTYYGFWELGRKVTLGPMEIASAFRAPVLEHPKVAAQGEVEVLLKEVGNRQVRYGEVHGTGKLGVAEPQMVKRLNTFPLHGAGRGGHGGLGM